MSILKMEQIYKPVIFILLYTSTPSYSDPMFYFYTNELKFTPSIMGRLKLIYGIASVIGITMYNKYLKNVEFKKIMFWSTVISMIFNMFSVILVTRLNLYYGISDFVFCMTADLLTTALAEINTMPLLVLACNLCPKNIEGTLYAFLMSVMNFGSLASSQSGAMLTSALGITNTDFRNLAWLIAIANIILVIPLPGLTLIKKEKYEDKKHKISD
jgi:predicted MFS family arabinose efflux permease